MTIGIMHTANNKDTTGPTLRRRKTVTSDASRMLTMRISARYRMRLDASMQTVQSSFSQLIFAEEGRNFFRSRAPLVNVICFSWSTSFFLSLLIYFLKRNDRGTSILGILCEIGTLSVGSFTILKSNSSSDSKSSYGDSWFVCKTEKHSPIFVVFS